MVTTATKTKRPMSLSEQARNIAVLECMARPENILDRSRPLPQTIERNLEQTINDLAALWFQAELDRLP